MRTIIVIGSVVLLAGCGGRATSTGDGGLRVVAAENVYGNIAAQNRVLLYNSQAVSPITARLRDAAQSAGIPVVPVSETLPSGSTFQQWQLGQARALAAALGR